VLLVAVTGGGVYLHMTNSAALAVSADPCRTATDLATTIVATLPAGN
jgi:hypothetical protein